ncbi:hypothetical protein [Shewanella marisflavi]|uniref:hypothetical protein n=1 Tax=Shewanella marisflavi TaxID=260364 RepID=UPI003AB08224
MDVKKFLNAKRLVLLVLAGLGVSFAALMFGGSGTSKDVQFGNLDELPSPSATADLPKENPSSVQAESQQVVTNDSVEANKYMDVEIPKFNYLVELGRVIQNARDKPEALLEAQYSAAIERMEDRNRLAQLVAQELSAKVDAEEQKRKLKEINGGVVTKDSDKPRRDVDPLLTTNELLNYNYVPADFVLKNVGKSVDGMDAIIEYRGEHYGAVVGKEIVAKVITKEIQRDRVVLKTPNGEFTITLRL